jgi:molybdopterin-guanine dinucleotide biosynthesis protein A
VVVACDQPFLDADVLSRLVALSAGADGAWLRTPAGVEPLIACYRRRARPPVRRAIDAGQLTLGNLAGVLEMRELDARDLPDAASLDRILANINSPDDYARIE